jgi:hypothetical protein
MITIGRMAEKYGKLPHEVIESANTYDLMIMDVLATYENYEQQKASGKVDPKVYGYNEDELKSMMEKARVKSDK